MVKSYVKGVEDMKIVSVLTESGEPLAINNFGYETNSERAHWGKGRRDMFILHYVLTGEGYYNGIRVKSGEGFLIRPMELHEYHSSSDAPWSYFYIIFSGSDAHSVSDMHVECDGSGIFTFDINELNRLKDVILTDEHVLTHTRAVGYFYLILSASDKTYRGGSNRYVWEAKRLMAANLHRPVGITEIARSIGISDRYLYNLFVEYEGCSVKSYMNGLKINHSKKLLQTTLCTITEIAYSLGFPDVLSFSKFFKKETGDSPSIYRDKRRAD